MQNYGPLSSQEILNVKMGKNKTNELIYKDNVILLIKYDLNNKNAVLTKYNVPTEINSEYNTSVFLKKFAEEDEEITSRLDNEIITILNVIEKDGYFVIKDKDENVLGEYSAGKGSFKSQCQEFIEYVDLLKPSNKRMKKSVAEQQFNENEVETEDYKVNECQDNKDPISKKLVLTKDRGNLYR